MFYFDPVAPSGRCGDPGQTGYHLGCAAGPVWRRIGVGALPNPSGLNRGFSLDRLVKAYGALRSAVADDLPRIGDDRNAGDAKLRTELGCVSTEPRWKRIAG